MQIDWLDILRTEVKAKGSVAAVARELGYARTSISLALSGKYPGGTDKLKAKVIATYCDQIMCPHTDKSMSQVMCTSLRNRAMPQSEVNKLEHWFSCQICPNNPNFVPVKERTDA